MGQCGVILPHDHLDDYAPDAITLTSCPACRGSGNARCPLCNGCGKVSIKYLGGSMYRYEVCDQCAGSGLVGVCLHCHGAMMITASHAASIRRLLA